MVHSPPACAPCLLLVLACYKDEALYYLLFDSTTLRLYSTEIKVQQSVFTFLPVYLQ